MNSLVVKVNSISLDIEFPSRSPNFTFLLIPTIISVVFCFFSLTHVKLGGQKVLPSTSTSARARPLPSTAAAASGTEMWNSIFLGPAGFGLSNTSEGCSTGALRPTGSERGREKTEYTASLDDVWLVLAVFLCFAKADIFYSRINTWPGDVFIIRNADSALCS